MAGVDDTALALGRSDDAVHLRNNVALTGLRIHDDATAVLQHVVTCVAGLATVRRLLEASSSEPTREVEPLAVLAVRMDENLAGRCCPEQVHSEGQQYGPLGQMMFEIAGVYPH